MTAQADATLPFPRRPRRPAIAGEDTRHHAQAPALIASGESIFLRTRQPREARLEDDYKRISAAKSKNRPSPPRSGGAIFRPRFLLTIAAGFDSLAITYFSLRCDESRYQMLSTPSKA